MWRVKTPIQLYREACCDFIYRKIQDRIKNFRIGVSTFLFTSLFTSLHFPLSFAWKHLILLRLQYWLWYMCSIGIAIRHSTSTHFTTKTSLCCGSSSLAWQPRQHRYLNVSEATKRCDKVTGSIRGNAENRKWYQTWFQGKLRQKNCRIYALAKQCRRHIFNIQIVHCLIGKGHTNRSWILSGAVSWFPWESIVYRTSKNCHVQPYFGFQILRMGSAVRRQITFIMLIVAQLLPTLIRTYWSGRRGAP